MTRTRYTLGEEHIRMVTYEVTTADSEYLLRDHLKDGRQLADLLADEDELERVVEEMANADCDAVLPGWYHAMDLGCTINWDTGPFDTEEQALADIPASYGSDVTEGPEPEQHDPNEDYIRAHITQLFGILAGAPAETPGRA